MKQWSDEKEECYHAVKDNLTPTKLPFFAYQLLIIAKCSNRDKHDWRHFDNLDTLHKRPIFLLLNF